MNMSGISLLLGSSVSQFFVGVIFVLTIAYLWSRRKNLPPGPWGVIPFIGYAPNIVYALYKGVELQKYLIALGRRYGKMYSFTAFGIQVVVLNDMTLIREAFQRMTLNDRGDNELQAKLFSPTCKLFKFWLTLPLWYDTTPRITKWRTSSISSIKPWGLSVKEAERGCRNKGTFCVHWPNWVF